MRELIAYLISGLVGGGLAAMISVSLVTTYTATGIFNLAQGSVALLGMYSYLELNGAAGVPTIPAALITVLVVIPLFGLLLEKVFYRRLSEAPELARIVATVGMALAIPAFISILLGYLSDIPALSGKILSGVTANPIPLGPNPRRVWAPGLDIVIDSDQVIVLAFTVVTAAVYWYILRRTRLGLEMRAVVDSHGLASIRGISRARVSRLSWVLSFASAGLVGVVGGISLGNDPNMYLELLFVSAAAVVLAGMRSIPLAFVFALLIGVAQNLVTGYLQVGPLAKVNGLGSAVPFVALLAGLYLMNRRRGRVAGTVVVADAPVELTRPRRNPVQRVQSVLMLAVAVVIISFVAGEYWDQFIAEGLAFSVIYLSLVVVTGQLGIVSFAQAGFVTCGGLLAGWLATAYGLPWVVAVLIAVAAAAVAGALVSIPAVKLGGLQLALASLAITYILNAFVFQVPAVQGTQGGGWLIPRPDLSWLNLTSNRNFALFLLFVFVILAIVVRNFQLSQLGRSALAVRGSRPAAASSGVGSSRVLVFGFALSGLLAGLGGFFYAQSLSQVSWNENPPLTGLMWVTVAILIGIRRPSGALVAGLTTPLVPQFISYLSSNTQWPVLIFGLGAVSVAQRPGGVLDLHNAQGAWLREHLLPGPVLDRLEKLYGRPMRTTKAPAVPPAQSGEPFAPAGATDSGERQPGLDVRGLRAGYGELEVLHGIDIAAPPHRLTAVFGSNGSGKSTLCSVLAGLLPAHSGSVTLNGHLLGNSSGADRMHSGVFVVTESRAIFPTMTVEENLLVALGTRARMEQALQQAPGLQARRQVRAGMLSGGEQQLLAMAPALVIQPKVLIADEPCLGLAPLARKQVLDVCQTLRDRGTVVLLTEERPGDVYEIADDIIFMHLGRIAWTRPKDEVQPQDLIDSYLSTPAPF